MAINDCLETASKKNSPESLYTLVVEKNNLDNLVYPVNHANLSYNCNLKAKIEVPLLWLGFSIDARCKKKKKKKKKKKET